MNHLLQEEIEVIIDKESSFIVECCVPGYHTFQFFWEALVGSVLIADPEDDLQSLIHDKFAIALVNNDSVTIGHISKFMSKLINFFHKQVGHIKCKINDDKKYSKDLEQDGRETPARLTFSTQTKKITDIMKENLNPLVEKYRRINSKLKILLGY